MKKNVEKILGAIEEGLSEGFYLRPFSGSNRLLEPYRDSTGGCCVIGMLLRDADTFALLDDSEMVAERYGISEDAAHALEAGFEGWTHVSYDGNSEEKEFYALGKRIAEDYV